MRDHLVFWPLESITPFQPYKPWYRTDVAFCVQSASYSRT